MAGKLSFSIAINLLTENFKRGTNQVKNAFRSMQAQVLTFAAALGAGGIGLSNLVSRFVEVARETSRVITSLKNVSGSMSQYADNQRYLLDIAKKYGLEINALTGNFAKFTAAASISGMSMKNQRKIFESVSRACTAFGMNADDSNGVMLALSQMMSKGKISSEELRLQMGERLPIALQAMAKAAGVSVAGLDKLLKQGKLMNADVLPKFAEALNEMIPSVDTDNLETSANRLKNMFTDIVNSSGVQGTYKSLIDWLTEAIRSAGENIKNIVIGVVALITGVVANGVVKWWTSISNLTVALEANAAKSNAVLLQATQQRIAAEIALEKAKTQSVAAEKAARIALDRALQKEQLALAQVASAEQKVADMKKVVDAQTTAKLMIKATQERVAAEIALETAKSELIVAQNANWQAQTYNETVAIRKRLQAAEANFASAEKTLAEKTAKEVAAQEAAKAAAANAAAVKSQGAWVHFCNTTKVAVGKLVISLRTLWNTFAPMIIISVITALIGKFFEMRKEAERIKNIFSDYKKELSTVSNTPEIAQLKVLQKLYNDAIGNKKLQEQYQKRIEGVVGEQIKKEQDINEVIKKRIKLLEATATVDFLTQKKVEFEDKNHQLGLKSVEKTGVGEKTIKDLASLKNLDKGKYNEMIDMLYSEGKDVLVIESLVREYAENAKALGDINKRIEDNMEYVVQNDTKMIAPITDPDDKKKKTTLQKQQESYYKQFEELGAELEIGKITQAEYNKALGELNIKMYAQAKGTGDKEVLESEYLKQRKVAAEKAVANMEHTDAMIELEKVQKSYNSKIKEVNQQHTKGLISQKELNKNIVSLSVEASKSAAGIKGIGDSANGFIAAMLLNAQMFASPVKVKPRDTTFDYKKTEVDIASENLDKAKELADAYKQHAEEIGKDLSDELANAMANVPTLESKLKIAQVKQDVKDFSKELNENLYSGIKDIASSSDRMVNAFESLRDVFSDVDASGWERIMAVWNAMTNTVDALMSIAKTIETLTELTEKLGKAKNIEAAIDTNTTQQKVTNAAIGAAATIAAAATEKTAATGEVAANTAKGASAAGASAAKLPFPWNIVAIGGAIAAAMAAFAVIPKFAGGGIIAGGPTSGDKILARVNAGEMILNGSQQSNLFDAINSGNIGGGKALSSSVSTKVRAKDLILTINNELKSQGKKPIS